VLLRASAQKAADLGFMLDKVYELRNQFVFVVILR
jgi:hypothetical protein